MPYKSLIYSVASILLALSSISVFANTPLGIPFSNTHTKIENHLLYRVDNPYNLKELETFIDSKDWTSYTGISEQKHDRKKSIWLKVDLSAKEHTHPHNLLLVVESSYIDKIDIFLFSGNDNIVKRSAGANAPPEQRSIKNRYILQPLILEPSKSYSLLIRTTGAFVNELVDTTAIWVPEHYYLTKHTQQTLNFGWQAGVLGILALLHAIAVFTYRKSLWLYSFTFIFSALAVLAFRDGYVFTLFNISAGKWAYKGIWAFMIIHSIAAIMMSRRILCPPKAGPLLCSRVLMGAVVLNLLAIPPILITTYEGISQIGNILSGFNLVVFTLLLFFATYQCRKKKPGLGGYLVAWSVFTFTCWATSPFFHHGLNALPIHASNMVVVSIVAISIWLYLYAVGSTIRKHNSLLHTQEHIANHLNFISYLTNEVRAALNGVVGTSDILRGQLSPANQDLVSTIQRSGRRLHHLTNNIQDFTILGRYSVKAESSPFQLDRLLTRLTHENHGVNIELRYASNTIFNLIGDSTRWIHTFDTLMDCSTSTKSIKHIEIDVSMADVIDRNTAVLNIQWIATSNINYSPKLLEISSLDVISQNNNDQSSYGLQLALFLCKTFIQSMSGSFTPRYRTTENTLVFDIQCKVAIDSEENSRLRDEIKKIGEHRIALLNDISSTPLSYLSSKLAIAENGGESDLQLLDGGKLTTNEIWEFSSSSAYNNLMVLNHRGNDNPIQDNAIFVGPGTSVRDIVSLISRALSDKSKLIGKAKTLRALVVEDDNVCRQIMVAILEDKLSINVDCATDGLRGLEMSTKNEYDLIFLDCVLPLLNGIALTKMIREPLNPNFTKPIIAVTAHRKNEVEQELSEAGTTDIIYKPIDINTMTDLVDRLSANIRRA